MKKSTFFIYVGYIFTKTLLGITFYPYKSVLETTRRPILIPVIFSPFVGFICLFIVSKIGSLLIKVYGRERELIGLFLSTAFISIIFWQTLLMYLLISFMISSRKNKY